MLEDLFSICQKFDPALAFLCYLMIFNTKSSTTIQFSYQQMCKWKNGADCKALLLRCICALLNIILRQFLHIITMHLFGCIQIQNRFKVFGIKVRAPQFARVKWGVGLVHTDTGRKISCLVEFAQKFASNLNFCLASFSFISQTFVCLLLITVTQVR